MIKKTVKKFKKAKMNRKAFQNESKCNLETTSDAILELNSKLLGFIEERLKNNAYFDFRVTGLMYEDAMNILNGKNEIPFLLNQNNNRIKEFINKIKKSNFDDKIGKNTFTPAYFALCSIYGINPKLKYTNSISLLLDQALDKTDDEKEDIKYIKLKDVVKSKGNSINGPRKEDVGNFNRKLFEKYSKEIEEITKEKLTVNLEFLDFKTVFKCDDKILFSSFIDIFVYDVDRKIKLGEFCLIIHKKHEKVKFTCFDNKTVLFKSKMNELIHSSHEKNTRKINVFDLMDFKLLEFSFNCKILANNAFELFFKNSVVPANVQSDLIEI